MSGKAKSFEMTSADRRLIEVLENRIKMAKRKRETRIQITAPHKAKLYELANVPVKAMIEDRTSMNVGVVEAMLTSIKHRERAVIVHRVRAKLKLASQCDSPVTPDKKG